MQSMLVLVALVAFIGVASAERQDQINSFADEMFNKFRQSDYAKGLEPMVMDPSNIVIPKQRSPMDQDMIVEFQPPQLVGLSNLEREGNCISATYHGFNIIDCTVSLLKVANVTMNIDVKKDDPAGVTTRINTLHAMEMRSFRGNNNRCTPFARFSGMRVGGETKVDSAEIMLDFRGCSISMKRQITGDQKVDEIRPIMGDVLSRSDDHVKDQMLHIFNGYYRKAFTKFAEGQTMP